MRRVWTIVEYKRSFSVPSGK